jgi:hypothetical protein
MSQRGSGQVRTGDVVVWLKPVAVAPAVVRPDGRVQAAGHDPPRMTSPPRRSGKESADDTTAGRSAKSLQLAVYAALLWLRFSIPWPITEPPGTVR